MEKLILHRAGYGYQAGDHPLRISYTSPGGWRVSSMQPGEKRTEQWLKANNLKGKIFASRKDAKESLSLALEMNPPSWPTEKPTLRYISPGRWRLAHGLEARKTNHHGWWIVYRQNIRVSRSISLWRAARSVADRPAGHWKAIAKTGWEEK